MPGSKKHGRCKRGVRPPVGSVGRPDVARRETVMAFWQLIARGMTSEQAGIEVGVSPAVGARWFRQSGGMPTLELHPLSGRYLSFAEREEIALFSAQRHGVREIARRLQRPPSTISRELRRNAATRSGYVDYRASTAQWHADRCAKRCKPAKLATNPVLRHYVQERLSGHVLNEAGRRVGPETAAWKGRRHRRRQDRRWARAWSPEQIANRLRLDFPDEPSMRISPTPGDLPGALHPRARGSAARTHLPCLRTGRALRVPRVRSRRRGKHFVTPDVALKNRPAEVMDRQEPGHWEGDLIVGLESSAIGTLVERVSRYTILLHLPRMEGHGEERTKNGPALAGHAPGSSAKPSPRRSRSCRRRCARRSPGTKVRKWRNTPSCEGTRA